MYKVLPHPAPKALIQLQLGAYRWCSNLHFTNLMTDFKGDDMQNAIKCSFEWSENTHIQCGLTPKKPPSSDQGSLNKKGSISLKSMTPDRKSRFPRNQWRQWKTQSVSCHHATVYHGIQWHVQHNLFNAMCSISISSETTVISLIMVGAHPGTDSWSQRRMILGTSSLNSATWAWIEIKET